MRWIYLVAAAFLFAMPAACPETGTEPGTKTGTKAKSLAPLGQDASPGLYRLTFEAEEFDGLPFFGNWYYKTELGWYVKEHRHASGRAFAVCDDKNYGATMTKRLPFTLPVGNVSIFVRVVLMRMGIGNEIRVALGTEVNGQFVENQSVPFRWKLGSGYGWLGQGVSLTRPCSHIRVQPVRIACRGIGDVPEVPQAQVLLDGFVLTNEPGAKVLPDPTGRGRTRLQLPENDPNRDISGAAEETVSSASASAIMDQFEKQHRKVRALKRATPRVERAVFPVWKKKEPNRNAVPNGSFEMSLRPWWFTQVNYYHGYDINIENLDSSDHRHGSRSLRLPLIPVNFTEASPSQYAANAVSRPFPVKPEQSYWFSFRARASHAGLKVFTPAGTYEPEVRWKQFAARITTGPAQTTYSLSFSVRNREPGRTLWLDEVELKEAGKKPGLAERPPAKFDVRNQLEVGFLADALGEIFYDDRPVEMKLIAANSRLAEESDTVAIRVLDTFGRTLESQAIPIQVRAYDQQEVPVKFGFRRRGAFLLVYWLESGRQGIESLTFSVVPNPKSPSGKRPFIGTYSQSVEAAMKLYARAGFDWDSPLNDRVFRATEIAGSLNAYKWYDHLVEAWNRNGIEFVGETIPSEKPRWDRGILGTGPAAGASRPFFQIEVWGRHVAQMVRHYKKVQYWILTDEAENLRTPKDYAPYAKAAYENAKKMNPAAQVMLSASVDMMEQVQQILGPGKVQDIFGGSRFNTGKWAYIRDRDFCRKHHLPNWNIGVGYPSFSMYELLDEGGQLNFDKLADLRRRLNREAFDLILQTSLCEPDRYCHYTGKLDGGRDPFTFFNADNTFKPHAIQYVNTLQKLRNAGRGALASLRKASHIEACYYQVGDWTYAVLNTAGSRGDYRIALQMDPADISVLDRNYNPVAVKADKESLQFDLPADELRIVREVRGRRVQFLDAVRNLEAEPYFACRSLVLPGNRDRNLLALCFLGRPLATRAEQAILKVSGQAQNVELKDVPQILFFDLPKAFGTRPISNLPVRYEFDLGDGMVYRDEHTMWAMTAPYNASGELSIDGDLSEWMGQTPVFLYASQSQDGSYLTLQARVGGHKIKELPDASANVYCRWNSQGLVFAARILDDDLRFAPSPAGRGLPGDQLVIYLDTDLLGDIYTSQRNEDDPQIVLGPGFGGTPTAEMLTASGDRSALVTGFKKLDDGYSVEVAVPWSSLGLTQGPGAGERAFGFDVVLKDCDGSLRLKSELSWSAYDGVDGDPTAFGQMILLPRPPQVSSEIGQGADAKGRADGPTSREREAVKAEEKKDTEEQSERKGKGFFRRLFHRSN